MFKLLIVGVLALQVMLCGVALAQEAKLESASEAQTAPGDKDANAAREGANATVKKSPDLSIPDQSVPADVSKEDSQENSAPEKKIPAEQQVSEANLVQQRRMADAAWCQIALSFLGLVALIWTLIETRRAIKVTRDIGQKQVKAYIQIAGLECAINPTGNNVTLNISCKNNGQSPAIHLGLLVQMSVNYDSPVSLPYDTESIDFFGDIASGETRATSLTYPGLKLRPDHYSEKFIGLANIEFRIVFLGQDVFGNEVSATLEKWWCRPDTGTPIRAGFVLEWVTDGAVSSETIRKDERLKLKRFAPQKQTDAKN